MFVCARPPPATDMKRLTDANQRRTVYELLGAIREGVHDAIWGMIANTTTAPCADFSRRGGRRRRRGDQAGAAKGSMM